MTAMNLNEFLNYYPRSGYVTSAFKTTTYKSTGGVSLSLRFIKHTQTAAILISHIVWIKVAAVGIF